MKKLKDVFYHINDVLLALIIIAIASGIIIWRIDKIMYYPQTLINQENSLKSLSEDQPKDNTENTSKSSENKEEATDSAAAGNNQNSTKSSDNQAESLWKDGALTKEVSVNISSGTSENAVNALISAGLFSSFDEFESVCSRIGRSVDSIKASTFTFPAGLTKEQIATQITN